MARDPRRRSPESSRRRRADRRHSREQHAPIFNTAAPSQVPRRQSHAESTSSSSSSTSSSLMNISRKTRSFGLRSFFTSSARSRTSSRRTRGAFRSKNGSSSSVDSDLAYGTGYIPKDEAFSPRPAAAATHRSVEPQVGPGGQPVLRRAQTDEEILDLGRKLSEYAKAENNRDLDRAGRSRPSRLVGAAAALTTFRRQNTLESMDRGIGPSRPQRADGPDEDSGWESDWKSSDDDSYSDGLDDGLTYGSARFSDPHLPSNAPAPPPVSQEPSGDRRRSSAINPALFGPVNSLRGFVNTPCGFRETDYQPPAPLTRFEDRIPPTSSAPIEAGPMRNIDPIPISDPTRPVTTDRSAVPTHEPQIATARAGPVPIQAPKPITPVSTRVLEERRLDDVKDRDTRSSRRKSGRVGWAEAVLAVGAVTGMASVANEAHRSKGEKEPDRREQEKRLNRDPNTEDRRDRTGDRKYDDGRKYDDDRKNDEKGEKRHRSKRDSVKVVDERDGKQPSRAEKEKREEVRRELARLKAELEYERQKAAKARGEEGSKTLMDDDNRTRDLKEENRTDRKGKRREDDYDLKRSGEPGSSQTQSHNAPVNPFQFQVDDDAFPTPANMTPKRPLTPMVVYVEREPKFDDDDDDEVKDDGGNERRHESRSMKEPPRMSRRDSYEVEMAYAKRMHGDKKHSSTLEETAEETTPTASAAEPARDSEPVRDPVQEAANQYYRQKRLAQQQEEEEIRSRSPSPDPSVVEKWKDDVEEPVPRIVTPPEMKKPKEKNSYAAPNADVRIDHVIEPKQLFRFAAPEAQRAGPGVVPFFSRDPSCERERPMLNLVLPTPIPTPVPTPTPEKQRAVASPEPVEDKVDEATSDPSVVIGPKNEIVQLIDSEDAPVTTRSGPVESDVRRDETETRDRSYEKPLPQDSVKADEQAPASAPKSSGGWGALAAALAGAGVAQALVKEHGSSKQKTQEANGDQARSATTEPPKVTERDVPPSQSRSLDDDQNEAPPQPGPKPSSPQTDMPGSFVDDLDFTATLAAGLQSSGFDPNIVIDDPTYRRRDSPPGTNQPASYQQSFAETVTDLGTHDTSLPSASRTADSSFVLGEVAETPSSEREAPPDEWDTLSKKGKKGKRKKKASGSESADTGVPEPILEELTSEPASLPKADDDFVEPKLSKKEQKKREKAAKAQWEAEEIKPQQDEPVPEPLSRDADGDDWPEVKLGKKEKKKRGKAVEAQASAIEEEPTPKHEADPVPMPPVDVDADDDDWPDKTLTKKEKKKREKAAKARAMTLEEDQPNTRELPPEEPPEAIADEWADMPKKKSKKSRKSAVTWGDSEDTVAPEDRTVSVPVDAFDDLQTEEHDEWHQSKEVQDEPHHKADEFTKNHNGTEKQEDVADKQSFLANAGTLGAGVGLTGALALAAAELSRSNATQAPQKEELAQENIDITEPTRSVSVDSRMVDPEIFQRIIKPAIDPQYGDLLPLPPSEPGSPTQELEDLPNLPESRPDTPPEQERSNLRVKTHIRRRSAFDTPTKSPSQTAVPIHFRLGQRSVPPSPGTPRSLQPNSPTPFVPEIGSVPKSRSRPNSWGKEIMPLYLVEKASSGSLSTDFEEKLPELPPSEPSSRDSPSPEHEVREGNVDYLDLDFPGPSALSLDTALAAAQAAADSAGSQETTPKAKVAPPVFESPNQRVGDSESVQDFHSAYQSPVSRSPLQERSIGDVQRRLSTAGKRPETAQNEYEPLPAVPPTKKGGDHDQDGEEPAAVDPMTKDRSSYLLYQTPPSAKTLDSAGIPERSPSPSPSRRYSEKRTSDLDIAAGVAAGLFGTGVIASLLHDNKASGDRELTSKSSPPSKAIGSDDRLDTVHEEPVAGPATKPESPSGSINSAEEMLTPEEFDLIHGKKGKKGKKGRKARSLDIGDVEESTASETPQSQDEPQELETMAPETQTTQAESEDFFMPTSSKKKKKKQKQAWALDPALDDVTPERRQTEEVPSLLEQVESGPAASIEQQQDEPPPTLERSASSSKKGKKKKKGKEIFSWEPEDPVSGPSVSYPSASEAVAESARAVEPILGEDTTAADLPPSTQSETATSDPNLPESTEAQPTNVDADAFVTQTKKGKKGKKGKKTQKSLSWEQEEAAPQEALLKEAALDESGPLEPGFQGSTMDPALEIPLPEESASDEAAYQEYEAARGTIAASEEVASDVYRGFPQSESLADTTADVPSWTAPATHDGLEGGVLKRNGPDADDLAQHTTPQPLPTTHDDGSPPSREVGEEPNMAERSPILGLSDAFSGIAGLGAARLSSGLEERLFERELPASSGEVRLPHDQSFGEPTPSGGAGPRPANDAPHSEPSKVTTAGETSYLSSALAPLPADGEVSVAQVDETGGQLTPDTSGREHAGEEPPDDGQRRDSSSGGETPHQPPVGPELVGSGVQGAAMDPAAGMQPRISPDESSRDTTGGAPDTAVLLPDGPAPIHDDPTARALDESPSSSNIVAEEPASLDQSRPGLQENEYSEAPLAEEGTLPPAETELALDTTPLDDTMDWDQEAGSGKKKGKKGKKGRQKPEPVPEPETVADPTPEIPPTATGEKASDDVQQDVSAEASVESAADDDFWPTQKGKKGKKGKKGRQAAKDDFYEPEPSTTRELGALDLDENTTSQGDQGESQQQSADSVPAEPLTDDPWPETTGKKGKKGKKAKLNAKSLPADLPAAEEASIPDPPQTPEEPKVENPSEPAQTESPTGPADNAALDASADDFWDAPTAKGKKGKKAKKGKQVMPDFAAVEEAPEPAPVSEETKAEDSPDLGPPESTTESPEEAIPETEDKQPVGAADDVWEMPITSGKKGKKGKKGKQSMKDPVAEFPDVETSIPEPAQPSEETKAEDLPALDQPELAFEIPKDTSFGLEEEKAGEAAVADDVWDVPISTGKKGKKGKKAKQMKGASTDFAVVDEPTDAPEEAKAEDLPDQSQPTAEVLEEAAPEDNKELVEASIDDSWDAPAKPGKKGKKAKKGKQAKDTSADFPIVEETANPESVDAPEAEMDTLEPTPAPETEAITPESAPALDDVDTKELQQPAQAESPTESFEDKVTQPAEASAEDLWEAPTKPGKKGKKAKKGKQAKDTGADFAAIEEPIIPEPVAAPEGERDASEPTEIPAAETRALESTEAVESELGAPEPAPAPEEAGVKDLQEPAQPEPEFSAKNPELEDTPADSWVEDSWGVQTSGKKGKKGKKGRQGTKNTASDFTATEEASTSEPAQSSEDVAAKDILEFPTDEPEAEGNKPVEASVDDSWDVPMTSGKKGKKGKKKAKEISYQEEPSTSHLLSEPVESGPSLPAEENIPSEDPIQKDISADQARSLDVEPVQPEPSQDDLWLEPVGKSGKKSKKGKKQKDSAPPIPEDNHEPQEPTTSVEAAPSSLEPTPSTESIKEESFEEFTIGSKKSKKNKKKRDSLPTWEDETSTSKPDDSQLLEPSRDETIKPADTPTDEPVELPLSDSQPASYDDAGQSVAKESDEPESGWLPLSKKGKKGKKRQSLRDPFAEDNVGFEQEKQGDQDGEIAGEASSKSQPAEDDFSAPKKGKKGKKTRQSLTYVAPEEAQSPTQQTPDVAPTPAPEEVPEESAGLGSHDATLEDAQSSTREMPDTTPMPPSEVPEGPAASDLHEEPRPSTPVVDAGADMTTNRDLASNDTIVHDTDSPTKSPTFNATEGAGGDSLPELGRDISIPPESLPAESAKHEAGGEHPDVTADVKVANETEASLGRPLSILERAIIRDSKMPTTYEREALVPPASPEPNTANEPSSGTSSPEGQTAAAEFGAGFPVPLKKAKKKRRNTLQDDSAEDSTSSPGTPAAGIGSREDSGDDFPPSIARRPKDKKRKTRPLTEGAIAALQMADPDAVLELHQLSTILESLSEENLPEGSQLARQPTKPVLEPVPETDAEEGKPSEIPNVAVDDSTAPVASEVPAPVDSDSLPVGQDTKDLDLQQPIVEDSVVQEPIEPATEIIDPVETPKENDLPSFAPKKSKKGKKGKANKAFDWDTPTEAVSSAPDASLSADAEDETTAKSQPFTISTDAEPTEAVDEPTVPIAEPQQQELEAEVEADDTWGMPAKKSKKGKKQKGKVAATLGLALGALALGQAESSEPGPADQGAAARSLEIVDEPPAITEPQQEPSQDDWGMAPSGGRKKDKKRKNAKSYEPEPLPVNTAPVAEDESTSREVEASTSLDVPESSNTLAEEEPVVQESISSDALPSPGPADNATQPTPDVQPAQEQQQDDAPAEDFWASSAKKSKKKRKGSKQAEVDIPSRAATPPALPDAPNEVAPEPVALSETPDVEASRSPDADEPLTQEAEPEDEWGTSAKKSKKGKKKGKKLASPPDLGVVPVTEEKPQPSEPLSVETHDLVEPTKAKELDTSGDAAIVDTPPEHTAALADSQSTDIIEPAEEPVASQDMDRDAGLFDTAPATVEPTDEMAKPTSKQSKKAKKRKGKQLDWTMDSDTATPQNLDETAGTAASDESVTVAEQTQEPELVTQDNEPPATSTSKTEDFSTPKGKKGKKAKKGRRATLDFESEPQPASDEQLLEAEPGVDKVEIHPAVSDVLTRQSPVLPPVGLGLIVDPPTLYPQDEPSPKLLTAVGSLPDSMIPGTSLDASSESPLGEDRGLTIIEPQSPDDTSRQLPPTKTTEESGSTFEPSSRDIAAAFLEQGQDGIHDIKEHPEHFVLSEKEVPVTMQDEKLHHEKPVSAAREMAASWLEHESSGQEPQSPRERPSQSEETESRDVAIVGKDSPSGKKDKAKRRSQDEKDSIGVEDVAVAGAAVSGVALLAQKFGGAKKKKGKKKKSVDKRTTRDDDMFDDPSLWEGADRKPLEGTRADLESDNFWDAPDPVDEQPESSGLGEQPLETDKGVDTADVLDERSPEQTREVTFDGAESPTLGQSDSESTHKAITRPTDVRRERSTSPAPVERAFSFPEDIAHEDVAYSDAGAKLDRGIDDDVPLSRSFAGHDDYQRAPRSAPHMSSITDLRQSISGLAPVQEEPSEDWDHQEHQTQQRSRQILATPEINRDSGFMSDSPSLRRRSHMEDDDHRDSGVHLRDWPETTPVTKGVRTYETQHSRALSPNLRDDQHGYDTPKSRDKDRTSRMSPFGEKVKSQTPKLREPSPPPRTPEPQKVGNKKRSRQQEQGGNEPAPSTSLGSGLAVALSPEGRSAERRTVSDNSPLHRLGSPESTRMGPRRVASNTSITRLRTPEHLNLRPDSPGSMRSWSGTPPLRRVDKRVSGDLRSVSLSQRSESEFDPATHPATHDQDDEKHGGGGAAAALGLAAGASAALALAAASSRGSQNNTPTANEGRVRARDMTDVYDGVGEGRIGSPRSPTRPHSMRRRQSMQVLELESKVEQLLAENRILSDARMQSEQSLSQRAVGLAADRDSEIDSLKQSLAHLQREVDRLTEVNEGLNSANAQIAVTHTERYRNLETQHADASREVEQLRGIHSQHSATLEEKDAEIAALRAQLEAAKDQIREMQQHILATKPAEDSDFLNIRDVDYFDHRCQQLCSHVQQWVLRFSKFSDMRACRLTSELNDEKIIDRLDNAVLDGSDVDTYLSDRVRRRDIFMSMTMTMIWGFVFTRYLFGMDREQRQKLKSLEKVLLEVGPPHAVRQWRAVTLTLLARRPAFKQQRDQDTEAVVQAVFQTLSTILPPPSNLEDQIQNQLRRVMREAVDLSIEMRTQRAEYMMLPPLQPEYDDAGELVETVAFNAQLMNERGGDAATTNEEWETAGSTVRVVLFPLVVKKGDDAGVGDDEVVVCPAQVLVARPSTPGKRAVRMVTPSSDAGGASLLARSVGAVSPAGTATMQQQHHANASNVSMQDAPFI